MTVGNVQNWDQINTILVSGHADLCVLDEAFHALFRRWFVLGWPAFFAMAAIFGLMIARPA